MVWLRVLPKPHVLGVQGTKKFNLQFFSNTYPPSMAYRRRYKKRRYRRRPYRKRNYRRRNYRRRTKRVSRFPASFPTNTTRRMTYSTNTSATNNNVTAITIHRYAMNGLFDPDITGVGHQPMGFDQLAEIYKGYRVISAKITAHFVRTDSLGVHPCMVGIASVEPGFSTWGATSQDAILETRGVKYKRMSFFADGNAPVAVVSKLDYPTRWTERTWNSDSMRGDASSNPSIVPEFHVFVMSDPAGNDDASVEVRVTITYHVLWEGRQVLAGS